MCIRDRKFTKTYGYDSDRWARRHVHGLNREYLALHGVKDDHVLLREFKDWLQSHPYEQIVANAPRKESMFLNLPIQDVCLPPWKDRAVLLSHRLAVMQCLLMAFSAPSLIPASSTGVLVALMPFLPKM